MKLQVKLNNGKTKTVWGTQKSKVDGRLLLKIGNDLYNMDAATTMDGNPLTNEMFTENTKTNNLNEIKEVLMWCNGWNAPKNEGAWSDLLADIQVLAEGLEGVGENYGKTESANKFVADVCKSVRRYGKCSEKQAYIIAKYASENSITLKE